MKKTILAGALLAITCSVALPVTAIAQQYEEEAVEEQNPVSGWFRFDADSYGPQFWFGVNYNLGSFESGGYDLAVDTYIVDTEAEFDLGLSVYVGIFSIIPMIGIVFDFDPDLLRPSRLVAPQFFTIIDGGLVYFESWIQFFWQDLFVGDDVPERDYFYTRNFLLIVLSSQFAFGPQIEIDVAMRNGGSKPVQSLPLGLRFNLGAGEGNVLGLFLGYEFMKEDDAFGLTGRFTFLRNW